MTMAPPGALPDGSVETSADAAHDAGMHAAVAEALADDVAAELAKLAGAPPPVTVTDLLQVMVMGMAATARANLAVASRVGQLTRVVEVVASTLGVAAVETLADPDVVEALGVGSVVSAADPERAGTARSVAVRIRMNPDALDWLITGEQALCSPVELLSRLGAVAVLRRA